MLNQNLTQIKVVAIGDSLTVGFPYAHRCSWVRAVEETLGVRIYNKGVNGDTTGQMLRRFGRDCLALEPSHVIITGGSNDAFAGKDVDDILGNITGMIEQALTKGIKPIIGLPPPLNPPADEKMLALYRAEMEAFAAEKGIAVINFYKAFFDDGGRVRTELFADGAHPNLAGYKTMTAAALRCLEELLAV